MGSYPPDSNHNRLPPLVVAETLIMPYGAAPWGRVASCVKDTVVGDDRLETWLGRGYKLGLTL
jgi:hypothetical protein